VKRHVAALAGVLVGLVACSSAPVGTSSDTGYPIVVQQSDDPAIPYGITAIDYHFHDAHPSLPLTPSRTVKFVNDGRVKHNVTFPDLGFSQDLPEGGVIEIDALGRKLGGPGTYTFFCAYHSAQGMVGTIVITAS
jgi:plastocyanin